ncbi:Tll0287-like domain-containing protein [Candidatus Marinarcus aquaticus]|uniref:Tll0287-like domain-containing protein n=1 Tax=Candidatus Marinarcus aquaticus TaxID=2044504 RepID=A0A4Q0XQT5_9BACT|nr:DUF3365 domain-containing protein [Candidatus Marinarcus aquaticus]RXJ54172.1 hypothetical protein CRV04_12400 [Candidatus Marinarcus aquaticus]
MKKSLIICSLCLMLFANEKETVPKDIALQEAKHAAHKLHTTLSSIVKAKFRHEGALAAATFCADESYTKIKELNEELGENISIKRVSLFNRNPKSSPQRDEIDILKAFDLLEESDAYMPNGIVQVADYNTYKVYFPAMMASKTCKVCHGNKSNLDPKIQTLFEEKYPSDKAFGFKSGQVRGAVIVTVKIKNEKNKLK